MASNYIEAYNKWVVDQSPENMAGLLDAFAPTINSEIQRYEGPKPLLRGRARVLAVKAVRSYNPMSGASLNTWLVTNLKPLARYGQQLRDIRVPEVALRQAAAVDRAAKDFESETGRPPTDGELADLVGISEKRVRDVRRKSVASIANGTLEQRAETSSSADAMEGFSDPGVSEASRLPFATEAVYQSLDDRDKKIYDWRTGSHGHTVLPAGDVALRLGVSNAAVSQRAAAIGRMISEVAQSQV